MPEVLGVATPQVESLGAPNTGWKKPEDPLKQLLHKAVPGVQEMSQVPQMGPKLGAPVYKYNPDPTPQPLQEATSAPESHDNDEGEGQPTPQVDGSLYARLRVLERERNLARTENDSLRENLGLLAKAIEKSGVLEEEEYEEEPLDPISRLAKGQDRIMEKIQEVENTSAKEREAQANASVHEAANAKIREFAARADAHKPGLYSAAAAHVINALVASKLEDNEGMTFDEAKNEVAEWVSQKKVQAYNAGLNPGEEFLKRAVLYGFDVDGFVGDTQNGKVRTQNGNKPVDGKTQIDKQRARNDALGSIATVQGTPVNDPIKSLSSMSEKDRIKHLYQMAKDKGQMRRPTSLSETLAHKIRR